MIAWHTQPPSGICMGNTFVIRRFSSFAVLAALLAAVTFAVKAEITTSQVTRHPMEIRALVDPQGVLAELPAQLQTATTKKNHRELALLLLAQSNACRVIADWKCQIAAGEKARLAAEKAHLPELQIRGLIAESRGHMALQDFTRGEDLLGDAERLLALHPHPELSADVFLAYSSLSSSLGKNALAADYAARGLTVLGKYLSLPIRIRLMRNRARALALLDRNSEAETILKEAIALTQQVQDPKLSAELYVEIARIARAKGEIATQLESGKKILALATQLNNSQVTGLGHEVLGLAELNRRNYATAEIELRIAEKSFRELKLYRDERRVLRALITSMLGRERPRAEMETLTARLVELSALLESDDRRLAADDFDARLKYAEQKFNLQRLEATAVLNAEREAASTVQRRFITIVALLGIVLFLVMCILFVNQRRSSARLKELVTQVRHSESLYRMLAENSRDLVVRMRLDGQRLYVSPSVKDMLGREPETLMEHRWDLVHPDDVEKLVSGIKDLGENGGSATIMYRAKHANGSYVWIEALARLVPSPDDGGPPEIVYSGRDISGRMRALQLLSRSESRMRAVTDNIPAIITHIDKNQRYLFANAYFGAVFDVDPQSLIGQTLQEYHGDKFYGDIKEYVENVLQGISQNFEGTAILRGKQYNYQSNYVPERDANGKIQGFYGLTFDITALKNAEAKLDQLTRIDSLTGVANRRHFDEQMSLVLARSRRHATAITLICLDIDRFKSINDNYGHPIGDSVIMAFAQRLRSCIREDDLIARLGGDEFIVLIENSRAGSGEAIAKKLMSLLLQPIVIDDITLQISASIGVAYCEKTPDAKTLMNLADQALYAAKAAGRNTYRLVNAD